MLRAHLTFEEHIRLKLKLKPRLKFRKSYCIFEMSCFFFRSPAAAYWCDVIAIIVVMSCLMWERRSSLSREGLRWLKNHLFPKEKNCHETWVTFWMLGGQEVEEMRRSGKGQAGEKRTVFVWRNFVAWKVWV